MDKKGAEIMAAGDRNVIREALVARDKIILPSPHISPGLMQQFMKDLHQNRPFFACMGQKVPGLSSERLKAGIFLWSLNQIAHKRSHFVNSMNETERKAWILLVAKNVLCNLKALTP
ncbi:hypothetical protein AVEN_36584-1 [Araneus ventricosus]|uniref:Uncharacterized protein n=1 Tax=Araneus ventricosus TaxID=182803 RepID=A0A4Y2Q4G3_ARAVE|nr:hypothetical protein AVEN_36584-1 [Araneus ventricosus]